MTIQKISSLAGAALLAGSMLAGAVAQAQPAPYGDDRRPPPPPARVEDRRPPPPPARPHRPPPPPPRMMAPPPPMAVGRPLPYDYRGYNYRVDNWNYYHLPRPRRGQYWVQYGGQFLLVNTGGIVLQVFVP